MIYVSSSCVQAQRIVDSIDQLQQMGFQHIELSGGTDSYKDLEADLIQKKKEGVQFLLHNYFPPPPVPFVLNLASLDEEVARLSTDHVRNAILLSEKLGATRYGVHAGFLINIPVDQIGRSISQQALFDHDQAMTAFVDRFTQLNESTDIELYIENNVIAPHNLRNFKGNNPFFLTDTASYEEMTDQMQFNLLLDVAHLKVSCSALELSFADELDQLLSRADYVHISDNDGLKDTNQQFHRDGELFQVLKSRDLKGKTFTLEVYGGEKALLESYEALHSLI